MTENKNRILQNSKGEYEKARKLCQEKLTDSRYYPEDFKNIIDIKFVKFKEICYIFFIKFKIDVII